MCLLWMISGIFFIIIVLISIFCFGTVIHYRKKPNQYHLYIIKWLLHHQPPSWQFTSMSHKQCSKIDFLCFILFHFLDRKCRQMQWVKTVLMGSSYKTGSQNRLVLWTKISNPLWFSLSKQGKVLKEHPPMKLFISISGSKFRDPSICDVAYKDPIKVRSVHFIGAKDWLRLPSEDLATAFDNPLIIRHPQGHTVPRLGESFLIPKP